MDLLNLKLPYIGETANQLLDLFSVSCQCDACKQGKVDMDYKKYIELNKNVIQK